MSLGPKCWNCPRWVGVMACYVFFVCSVTCGGTEQAVRVDGPLPVPAASVLMSVRLDLNAAFAAEYQLPDTGQERCYDGSEEIPCPGEGKAYHGQDAQYEGYTPSFKDNGDGTVSDLNTRLVWQQGDSQNSREYDWDEAGAYCGKLVLAGKDDWRLPSRRELMSIVNYGTSYPAVDEKYFPGCKSEYYWSSSTYTYNPLYAWDVYFGDGYVGANYKHDTYYVRCVRGDP